MYFLGRTPTINGNDFFEAGPFPVQSTEKVIFLMEKESFPENRR